MTYKPEKNLPAAYERRTDELVATVSPANQDFVRIAVEARRNERQKPRSIYAYALASSRLDAIGAGKPFEEFQKADYVACLTAWRPVLGPRSLQNLAHLVKLTYRDVHNTDNLPRDVRKALSVKVPKEEGFGEGRVVTDPEFSALLQAAQELRGGSMGVPCKTMWTAILWVMLDSGVRSSELLGLLTGDVEFDPPGLPKGTALLHLRPDGRVLKTGPRVVPVSAARPALEALLSVHPHHEGARSPLFLARRHRVGDGRLQYLALNRGLTALANSSGVNAARALTENVTPHDFRHTCATEKARLGWEPLDLMKFFGGRRGAGGAGKFRGTCRKIERTCPASSRQSLMGDAGVAGRRFACVPFSV